MSSVTVELKEYDDLIRQCKALKKDPEKVLKRLTADCKKRVPGWVAGEVVKHYGVKKNEISGGQLGSLKITGNSFKQLKFIYTGRILTPTHFKMSPTAPKPNRGGYTLKATVIKGKRTTLGKVKKLTKKQMKNIGRNFQREGTKTSDHSPIMLMRANGGHYLPFQRKSTNRNDIKAIKTISLPQMISGDRAREDVHKAVAEGVQKRLQHHMGQVMK